MLLQHRNVLFFSKIFLSGPLTKTYSDVIVGTVVGGRYCTRRGKRVGIYVDLLRSNVQKFIKDIVPDLEFEGGTQWNN